MAKQVRLAVLFGLAVMLAGLLARILNYPLNRDEQLFVTAAAQLSAWRLYDDLGFNHLPNFVYLLSGIYRLTGTGYLLLTGRIVTFLLWIAALAALWLIARRQNAGGLMTIVAWLLLLGNVLLLGPPGMLVTNNLVPVPLALFAFHFLLRGLDNGTPSAFSTFLAGVFVSLAIGFKANYIFLAPPFAAAALLAPADRPLARRFTGAVIPLAAGGLAGGLPVLAYFVHDAPSLLAHTLRYFTDLHSAYWANSGEPQISTISARTVLAEQIWLSNGSLLALCGTAALMLIPVVRYGPAEGLRRLYHWPILLVLSLIALGVAVSFVPAPSFPQYFVPPVPFMIVALIVSYGQLELPERGNTVPLLLAIALLAAAGSASRLLHDLPRLASPATWTGVRMHREAAALARRGGLRPGDKVATLLPVNALEAGLSIYPEFASGPFVYRVADYISSADRRYYRTTSESRLHAFLDADPPAAVLTGIDEPLDRAFEAYAVTRGYREVMGVARPGGDSIRLFVRSH